MMSNWLLTVAGEDRRDQDRLFFVIDQRWGLCAQRGLHRTLRGGVRLTSQSFPKSFGNHENP